MTMDLCGYSVRLGEVEFSTSGTDVDTVTGAVLSLHSMRGWDDSAEDTTSTHPHHSGDGQVPGMSQYASRQIVLQGLVIAPYAYGSGSPSDIATLMKRLRRSTLYVSELDGLAREVDVRPDWQMTRLRGAPRKAVYTLSLIADDPLLYNQGSVVLPAGSTALPNCGDKLAQPIIDFSGPGTLTIEHPGGTLSVTTTDSRRRTIDCRRGVILDPPFADGRPGNRWLHPIDAVNGPWPGVLPGGSTWTTSHEVTVRRWEAWS